MYLWVSYSTSVKVTLFLNGKMLSLLVTPATKLRSLLYLSPPDRDSQH